ncbi:MAG: HTH domain-containing protein [Candidatus Woesearchaeota archaeon]
MRGDKRERILRVLLNSKEPLSKNELSKRADCSRQWVILYLKELEKKKLIKGTAPSNRKKLLEYWIILAKKPKKFRSYMVKEPLDLLKKSKLDYTLTTYQAENIVQHYLFPSRIDVYIKEEDLNSWHSLMTKNGLYGKGNVKVIVADPHVMYGKRIIDGLSIVSLPQLILDLTQEGGPCQEAAEMLMKRL